MNPRLRLLTLSAAAAAATLAPSALAAPDRGATCNGLPVTIAAHRGDVQGTPRADVIRLTAAGTVHSGAGADVVCGSPQPDRIYSGAGDDVVLGGGGGDVIRSGSGRDRVYGEGGSDHIHGGRHRDVLVPGSGWDVTSAGDLDSVESGRYAVSIVLEPQDVAELAETGQNVALLRPGGTPVTPVWTTFPPLPTNSVTFGDLAVFATQAQLVPNLTLLSEASTFAEPGTSWTFNPYFTFTPDGTAGAPGQIRVTNQNDEATVLGLAQGFTVNASSGMSPVSAVQVFPEQGLLLTPPTSVTVFPAGMAAPGTLLAAPPGSAVTVTPTPEHPTATITWDNVSGSFIAAP